MWEYIVRLPNRWSDHVFNKIDYRVVLVKMTFLGPSPPSHLVSLSPIAPWEVPPGLPSAPSAPGGRPAVN